MLIPLIYGGNPYGIFDNLDTNVTLGGEVASLKGIAVTAPDKHARDIDDGYATTAGSGSFTRPAATCVLDGSEAGSNLFLTDDGIKGYGTLFGSMIGTNAGTVQGTGFTFGPPSYAGSGKMTLWSNPGLYGVTLDALDATLNVNNGLLQVGSQLSYSASGKLTLGATASGAPVTSPTQNRVGSAPIVATFLEFTAGDTLVSTPNSFARSGTGIGITMKYAVINWRP